jgi:hypothetical protein
MASKKAVRSSLAFFSCRYPRPNGIARYAQVCQRGEIYLFTEIFAARRVPNIRERKRASESDVFRKILDRIETLLHVQCEVQVRCWPRSLIYPFCKLTGHFRTVLSVNEQQMYRRLARSIEPVVVVAAERDAIARRTVWEKHCT